MFKNALYYQEEKESYKAKVLSCLPLYGKEKEAWEKRVGKSFPALFLLRLSEDPFYPEGGGQAPDKGTIDGAEVLFVENVEDEYIVHLLAKDIPVGKEVLCKPDYAYRRRQSENHSGEHIFAGLINRRFGFSNVGFHMELLGDNPHVTVDFNGEFTEEELSELEVAVNEVIRKNLPIEEKYIEKQNIEEKIEKQEIEEQNNDEQDIEKESKGEELGKERAGFTKKQEDKPEFRQKKAFSGAIRVVSIPEVDSCACCGTHVKRTGEIGLFKLLSFEKHRGGTRIFLLAGELAVLDSQKKESMLLNVSRSLSTEYFCLSERVEKLKGQIEEERGRRIALSLQAVELLGNRYKKELFIQKRAVFTGKPLLGEALEYYGNKNLAVFHFPDFEMILLNKACESLKSYVDTDFFCFSSYPES